MGMLAALATKTLNPSSYARITNELASTIVQEARLSLSNEGNTSPAQDAINDRAHRLYLVGARQFRHSTIQRFDMHKAIERLTGGNSHKQEPMRSAEVTADQRSVMKAIIECRALTQMTPEAVMNIVRALKQAGFVDDDGNNIWLTDKGLALIRTAP